ncbi:hypothetical protein B0H10DRAFT_2106449 [Mycena sp. CBHHK59/15]|nr:hypothetical protein B0H10DRAFT_2106449 [Mycena sp. CBHHK59/15]
MQRYWNQPRLISARWRWDRRLPVRLGIESQLLIASLFIIKYLWFSLESIRRISTALADQLFSRGLPIGTPSHLFCLLLGFLEIPS